MNSSNNTPRPINTNFIVPSLIKIIASGNKPKIPLLIAEKIVKITDFLSHHTVSTIPDPYYGDEKGFEYALDLLEDACSGFFNHLKSR